MYHSRLPNHADSRCSSSHQAFTDPLMELREKIEDDIATGRIMPGSKLDETELAARFRVSRHPFVKR